MKYNEEILSREKMRAFLQLPPEIWKRNYTISFCTYENKPHVVIAFFNDWNMVAFRMEPAEHFVADELVELFKIHTYEGGTIDDNWYETFSKWVKQIP